MYPNAFIDFLEKRPPILPLNLGIACARVGAQLQCRRWSLCCDERRILSGKHRLPTNLKDFIAHTAPSAALKGNVNSN